MPQVTTTVEFRYDSLSRSLEESQVYGGNTRNVTNQSFESYPTVTFTLPDGQPISGACDPLYRQKWLETETGFPIADWRFFGPSRVAEVKLGLGVNGDALYCTYMNNARTHSAVQSGVSNPSWGDQSSDRLGYDGSGRPITKRFLAGGINATTHAYNDPSAAIGFTTSYDKASNKFYERALHAENRSHLYQPFNASNQPTGGYDSLDRLRQYQRGALSSTGGPGNLGGGSITTPITLTNTNESAQYDLDGLGNWRRLTTDPVGGAASTQIRQHNGLNEITRVDSTPFAYDGVPGASNGNLANDGTLKYEWDALNRLVKVYKTPATPVLIGEYTYDAMNRRIRRVVTNGGLSGTIPNGTTDCLYEGWRCVEERNGSNNATKQYVWGIYLDELIQMKLLVSENNLATGAYYPLQDLLYRTTGLADSSGVIREAYDYDAYGNTLIFRNSGSPPSAITWTSDTQVPNPTCPFLFTGQRYDAETRNYYYKMRYYSPRWGRFFSRDANDTIASICNQVVFCYSNSVSFVDSFGLVANKHHWFSQSLVTRLNEICGEAFALLGYTTRQFIDEFTTTFDPGWGRGSKHDEIHFRQQEKWNNRVKKIYDSARDCCDVLERMSDFIYHAYRDALLGPDIHGPVQYPILVPHKDPSNPIRNDLFRRIIDDICRPPCPKPKDPLPVIVPSTSKKGVPEKQRMPMQQRVKPKLPWYQRPIPWPFRWSPTIPILIIPRWEAIPGRPDIA